MSCVRACPEQRSRAGRAELSSTADSRVIFVHVAACSWFLSPQEPLAVHNREALPSSYNPMFGSVPMFCSKPLQVVRRAVAHAFRTGSAQEIWGGSQAFVAPRDNAAVPHACNRFFAVLSYTALVHARAHA